jgi:hypothetical protein
MLRCSHIFCRQENSQLSARLQGGSNNNSNTGLSSDGEKRELEKTIEDLNKQIKGLQLKLMERLEEDQGPSSPTVADDLLHNILILDSDLKVRHGFNPWQG